MPDHFLTVHDLKERALDALFDHAEVLSDAFARRAMPRLLEGRRVALSFEDGGFRNRVAFELGIKEMGGEAIYIPGRPGERESPEDIARYLSNWFDAIVIRTPEFETVQRMAEAATIPVINARTRHNHPCEILGDLAYARSVRGDINWLTVVFVGEATNLCHSWMEAAATLPIEVIQVCPPGYEADIAFVNAVFGSKPLRYCSTNDLEAALEQADIVYTDCWPRRSGAEEYERVQHAFAPYQITAALLQRTSPECIFLPCPPVTRGEEVSDDAMVDSRCKVYAAKDYLLHAQNALIAKLITENERSKQSDQIARSTIANIIPSLSTPRRTLYMVQRLHWHYNDEGCFIVSDEEPIQSFTDRAEAEQFRKYMELSSRVDYTEEEDRENPTLIPRDDPEFVHDFFEVVEVELL